MPPRITPDAGRGRVGRDRSERGGGRGSERGGERGGWRGGDSGAGRGRGRGGSRGSFRGEARERDERGVCRSLGDRGAAHGGGGRGRGPDASNPTPAPYVQAIGARRPRCGNSGQWIKLKSNHVEVTLDQGTIYHYDGMYLSSSIKYA
jgi:hypothetical protein